MKNSKQVSAGGVIYKKSGAVTEIALIARKGAAIWCLPKGKIEDGESETAAAGREVKEETGLEGVIEQKLGDITYWFTLKKEKIRYFKRVHFYLMRYESGETNISGDPDSDIEDVRWFEAGEALKTMTYPTERKMVKKAISLIS